jgi:hypothetical protein
LPVYSANIALCRGSYHGFTFVCLQIYLQIYICLVIFVAIKYKKLCATRNKRKTVMKKLIIFLFVVFGVFVSASAQKAGKIWVGGSIGFESAEVKDGDDYTNYKFFPELGYVVNDKISVGISIGFQQQEINLETLSSNDEVEVVSVSPFLRYSMLKSSFCGFFVDAGVEYVQAKNKDTDVKITGFGIGLHPGIAFNVSEKIQLTAKVGYFGYQTFDLKTNGRKATLNAFGLDLDLSEALFGVNFIF